MARAMRTWAILAGLLLLGAPAATASGDLSVFLGQNDLDDDRLDAAGVGTPAEVGLLLNLDFQWPVVLAVDFLRSSEGTTQEVPAEFPLSLSTDVETLALHVGVRYFFQREEPLRPYVGGGVGWAQLDVKQVENGSFGPGADYQTLVVDEAGDDIGVWVGAGLLYRLRAMQLGADVRYTDASAEVTPAGATESLEVDSGGFHAGVFVGWSW